jgi:glycine oxidase
VVGAGIVGLACAEELVRGGHDVRVLDPEPAAGATRAAAGMLAPAGEAWHGEHDLLRLGLASASLWPAYASRLSRDSGHDVGFRPSGTLLVGQDHGDLRDVERTLAVLSAHDVAFTRLDRQGLSGAEPELARAAGGALLPDDHSVDPRRVAAALIGLLGERLTPGLADRTVPSGLVLDDGREVACDTVVWATGVAARALGTPVRPVTGETIRLWAGSAPGRVVRARVRGESVYVVPRSADQVVVGASEEERVGEPRPRVGAVVRLLHAARTVLPALEHAEVLEITSRHRPGTPDNGPLLGPRRQSSGRPREVVAVGHYRGGVLLAPLTAQVVRAYVEGRPVPSVALPFRPDRFDRSSHDHRDLEGALRS